MTWRVPKRRLFARYHPPVILGGGASQRARELMLLCEAAGYDVVIVETVGVGQSETEVARMVDCFISLQIAGGGDDLQGIKKGLMEVAGIICSLSTKTMAIARYQCRHCPAYVRECPAYSAT